MNKEGIYTNVRLSTDAQESVQTENDKRVSKRPKRYKDLSIIKKKRLHRSRWLLLSPKRFGLAITGQPLLVKNRHTIFILLGYKI